MTASNEFFDVEHRGRLGVLKMKPHGGVALAEVDYAHAVLEAIQAFESESLNALFVSVPSGNFGAERMDAFWETARHTQPEAPILRSRFAHSSDLPAQVFHLETGVVQLLRLLRRVDLFKIIAVEGNVDFDLLGVLLAFDVRFCTRNAVFENHILARGVAPGFGVLWSLAQHVGQATLLDLVLNRRSLDAEEALRLKLVTHVSESGATTADAERYAEEVAQRPAAVLHGLVRASRFLHADFETYLEKLGGGFTELPPV